MLKYNKFIIITALLTLYFSLSGANSVRLKDLVTIQGIKENQLSGIGLVTGLNGNGDSAKSELTRKMVYNLAANHGVDVDPEQIKSKNVAVVFITSRIGGFTRIGDSIDVTVSSLGDAKSLEGGILLQSALRGANGNIYAVAQGRIISGSEKLKSQLTASIPQGAIIEKEILSTIIDNDTIRLILKHPDFTTASLITESLTAVSEEITVTAKDPGLIEIKLTGDYLNNPVSFISEIEIMEIQPDNKAMVIIDRKTGMIITGEKVKIDSCAVSIPGLMMKMGRNNTNNNAHVKINSQSVDDLVQLLNKVSITPDELVALFESLHKSGSLHGQLIVQ